MNRRLAAVVFTLLVALGGEAMRPGVASAAPGPYTLPFFDPSVGVTQAFGCTGRPWEPAYGSCAHWHAGIDYGLAYSSVAAARAGTVVRILEAVPAEKHDDPRGGNYVILDHGGSRFTLYYHLQYNGVYPALSAKVSAGQNIALSGNTGASDGPHLHYALLSSLTYWNPAYGINPAGQWTTDPGRVPWLAEYHSESNAGTEYIRRGTTITHWVKFRNIGGRTWTQAQDGYGHGRIILAATDATGWVARDSAFRAADWSDSWFATLPDQTSVAPNGVGTFTFGLKANPTVGSYREHFNLRSQYLRWFDYSRIGGFYIPIQVTAAATCSTCA